MLRGRKPVQPEGELITDSSRVTVAVVGPVKAGKSSLINAVLGDQKAAVDVVPLTASSTRYDLNQAGLEFFRSRMVEVTDAVRNFIAGR